MFECVFSCCKLSPHLLVKRGVADCCSARYCLENQSWRRRRVVEQVQRVQQRPVKPEEVAERATETAPHIALRNIVPAAFDTVPDAPQGQVRTGNPDVKHVQPETGVF